MTWIGKWLQSVAGAWFGPDEPEAPGAMRATLRGSSALSGQLDGAGEPVAVNISADLHGTSTFTATIPAESVSGGGVRRLWRTVQRIWKKPEPIVVELSAVLAGKSLMMGIPSAKAGMVAGINAGSSFTANPQATAALSAGLSGAGNISGKGELQKAVTADMQAALSGGASLTASAVAVKSEPPPTAADNHDDDEMTMLLLLAA